MILFLDDDKLRTRVFRSSIPSATCVDTAEGMISQLKNLESADCVFLDHDFGGQTHVSSDRADTGMEVVRWIVENKPKIGKLIVHTHNDDAGDDMTDKLVAAGYVVTRKPFIKMVIERSIRETAGLN